MGDFCSGKKIHNQIKEIGDTLGLTTFVAVVGQTQGELSILDVSPRLSLSRHKNSLLPTQQVVWHHVPPHQRNPKLLLMLSNWM